ELGIAFGHMELEFETFETCCLIENTASVRVLEKVGFERVKEFEIGIDEKHAGKKAKLFRLV
ncbi:MAG: GNAT family protein, partial [Anaerobacillus sp.]